MAFAIHGQVDCELGTVSASVLAPRLNLKRNQVLNVLELVRMHNKRKILVTTARVGKGVGRVSAPTIV